MKNGHEVGNNGNRLFAVLTMEEIALEGLTVDEIYEIAKPYMRNLKHLNYDNFWDDFIYTAEENGIKLRL